MTQDPSIVSTQSVVRPARFRGPLQSQTFNDTQEELVKDVANLTAAVNSIYSQLAKSIIILQNENAYLRRQVDLLRNDQNYYEQATASVNGLVTRFVDFSDSSGISFPGGLDDSKSAMLNAEFGEVTLPVNAIENKFFVISLSTGSIVTPPDLSVSVQGTFDKVDGNGLVNYERGGKVSPGDPKLALNGINETYWIRRVEFPLDSRVDQVECEFTVQVPEGASTQANLIEVLPFPNGSIDITSLSTASDLGNNFTTVPGFSEEDNITPRRYHFSPTVVDQVKLRLRQRNWVEENGKKVFYYGLQELSLKLADYDRNYIQGATFGNNNCFIVEIPAPDGFVFGSLYRIDPSPNFLLEDMSKRHVHVRLGVSSDFTSGLIWDSDSTYPPQQSSSPITVGATKLYAFIELNYVNESGGSLSPFLVGTTPFMKGLGLSYTLISV